MSDTPTRFNRRLTSRITRPRQRREATLARVAVDAAVRAQTVHRPPNYRRGALASMCPQ
jgi:hypothetical protein